MSQEELLRRLDEIEATAELADSIEEEDARSIARERLRKQIASLRDDVWKEVIA